MPQSFRLQFTGAAVEHEIRAAAARGLYLAAEHVLARSTEVVPLDEGPLQHSGTASVDAGSLSAAVSYDTPYAVRQHEELDYRHAPGRQAKYLEGPLNGARGEVAQIIAAQVRRALR
ncbi:minor capsid protein [Streptomyces sp. NPDC056512]|uniref:minor capsid protein n=1 Tax=Streptomyces sp. NPDC056512 TaxID=3345846 RepID=UPI003691A2A3